MLAAGATPRSRCEFIDGRVEHAEGEVARLVTRLLDAPSERTSRKPDLIEGRLPEERPLPVEVGVFLEEDPSPYWLGLDRDLAAHLTPEPGENRVRRKDLFDLAGERERPDVVLRLDQPHDLGHAGLPRPADSGSLLNRAKSQNHTHHKHCRDGAPDRDEPSHATRPACRVALVS